MSILQKYLERKWIDEKEFKSICENKPELTVEELINNLESYRK